MLPRSRTRERFYSVGMDVEQIMREFYESKIPIEGSTHFSIRHMKMEKTSF